MRRVTITDRFFEALPQNPRSVTGLVFLVCYGAYLVGIGTWGAVVERRFMTRELP